MLVIQGNGVTTRNRFIIYHFKKLDTLWYEPTGMEFLEPTISLKTLPRKPKSSQWMENLDSLRTCFKNLDYIKIKTYWRTYLKNSDYKEKHHKGCDLPISSKFNQEQEEKTQLTMKIQYIVCLQMRLQRVFKPKPN